MTITEQIKSKLAETTKLAEAAQKGPWVYEYIPGTRPGYFQHAIKVMRSDHPGEDRWTEAFAHNSDLNKANGRLCAAARTAIPALIEIALVAVEAIHPSECEYIGDNGSTCDDRHEEPCDGCLNERTLARIMALAAVLATGR